MQKQSTDITAFILSGGKSNRIGINKALLMIEGKTLIQRLLEIINTIFSEVIIISNEPVLYQFTKKKIISDIFRGRGPLGGIHSALHYSDSEKNFFVSCDMPFINKDLIEFVCRYNSEKEIIISKADGRIQQLCGIYSKRIFPVVDSLLKESEGEKSQLKGSIFELLDRVDKEIIDITGLNFYHPNLFFNINTPEDFNYARKILEKKDSIK